MRVLSVSIIIALLIVVVVLGRAVVRLENYHYASFVGLCSEYDAANPMQTVEREKCLHGTETRIHWIFHIIPAIRAEY